MVKTSLAKELTTQEKQEFVEDDFMEYTPGMLRVKKAIPYIIVGFIVLILGLVVREFLMKNDMHGLFVFVIATVLIAGLLYLRWLVAKKTGK